MGSLSIQSEMNIKKHCRYTSKYSTMIIPFFAFMLSINANSQSLIKNYTTNDGLSTDYIECIAQDSCGFMWIGTKNGLDRFDGNSFTEGRIKDFNSELLFKNRIYSLFLDHKKYFWAGTDGNGLVKYNYEKDLFETIPIFGDKNLELDKRVIKDICEDNNGAIWIATPYFIGKVSSDLKKINWYSPFKDLNKNKNFYINALYISSNGVIWVGYRNNGGLYTFNRNTNKLEKVTFSCKQINNSGDKLNILSLKQINDSILLIGTEGSGLLKLNINNKQASQYLHSDNNRNSISNNEIWSITIDSKKTIYTGSLNGGLDIFNIHQNQFFHQNLNNTQDIKTSISALFEDKWGNMWIGTHNNGIYILKNSTNNIKTFSESSNQYMHLNNNQVSAFYIDKDHKIWIGTDGGGLICFDQQANTWKRYGKSDGLQSNVILSITELPDNTLWMATWGAGIAILNKTTHRITHITQQTPNTITHNNIKNILFDGRYVWIATHGDGINLYDWNLKQFVQYKSLKYASFDFKKPMWGNQIVKDSKNNIWVATTTGLYMFNGKILSTFFMDTKKRGSIPSNYISCIIEDSKGTLWFGTNEGLCKYDFTNRRFNKTKHTILNESIKAMVEDSKQNLWITTTDGFVKFNYIKDSILLFNELDNMIPPPYTERAFSKASNGYLIAGGTDGFILFNPDSLHLKTKIPILLTSIDIANVPVDPIKKNNIIHKQIFLEDTITIKYNQNVISLHFHALIPLCEKSLYYSYKLEGFDTKWQSVNFQTSATYTNLPPGTYTFIVKTCNKQGFELSRTRKLNLIVLPPWWRTLWFKLLILFTLIGLIISIFYLRLRAITSRNRYLELTVNQRTSELIETNSTLKQEQQKVIDQNEKLKENQLIISIKNDELTEILSTKDKLLSIIGHDVKNPLSAVIGFLSLMPNSIESANKDKLRTFHSAIFESITEIQKLFDNLLDWSLGQSGKISYSPQEVNIDSLLKDVLSLTKATSNKKNITIQYSFLARKKAFVDPRMISTVLRNFIQNSIKFTNINGVINILVTEKKNVIECIITDNGVGMTNSQILDIIENKSTISSYGTNNEKGTGLGLQTCKAFIEKNNGTIAISSLVDHGTTISFTIPIGTENIQVVETGISDESNKKIIEKDLLSIDFTSDDTKEVILFIDDNSSILEYLFQIFTPIYTVITATDGLLGLEKAKAVVPDIIVSDIMMPKMNGWQLCQTLKTDIITQHIPIILLTAENTSKKQIEGLLLGAEDYITKPFDIELLKSKVKTILLNRANIKNHLKQIYKAQKNDFIDPDEDLFMQKFRLILEENIDNYNISIEYIADKVGYSRAQVYRKCLAITGLSPHDYIKSFKIHMACFKLKNTNYSISEIAYDLGFTDPKYFSTIFSKEMGITPRRYRES
jgi:signal transduction histidine kinase/ligand-binding sensor domain-containing protein/CheY-like chemotaxis protein/AraC-like DNA-binding protein